MSTVTNAPPEITAQQLPAVPLTLEGASMLHQMLRMRWTAWKQLAAEKRAEIAAEASRVLGEMEQEASGRERHLLAAGTQGRSDPGAFPAVVR